MDYLAAGNVMVDSVRFQDGRTSDRKNMGGPAPFAYSGIRVWTDSARLVCNVGADFTMYFNDWILKNRVDMSGIKVKCDHCNHSYLVYFEDGTYGQDDQAAHFRSDWMQDLGYLKTTPEEIGEHSVKSPAKGLYLAQNVDHVFWEKLGDIKKRDKFKIMWEIEGPSSYSVYMEDVLNALESVDAFSINLKEAQNLFDVKTEAECIRKIQQLPVEYTLFRVGKKGAYSVTPKTAVFVPSLSFGVELDPTGCGNTSTGAALYAFCEGFDEHQIGVMANVASALNVRQFGLIPDFSAVRTAAIEMAVKYCAGSDLGKAGAAR
jgi:sugar/nucleoside kinase (ribokinase family)